MCSPPPSDTHLRLSSTAVQYSREKPVQPEDNPEQSDSLITSQIPLLRSTASLFQTSNALSHMDKWASTWIQYWWAIGFVCSLDALPCILYAVIKYLACTGCESCNTIPELNSRFLSSGGEFGKNKKALSIIVVMLASQQTFIWFSPRMTVREERRFIDKWWMMRYIWRHCNLNAESCVVIVFACHFKLFVLVWMSRHAKW